MKNKLLIIFAVIIALIIALFFPTKLPVSENQVFGKNKILIEYEIFGCGSIITKVVNGGEELVADIKKEHPDIATDEVVFTEDSDQPVNHIDNADFMTAGLASGFRYVIYGEVIGVTQGAPDCCDPKPAYNDKVPLFKVTNWSPTRLMPYSYYENILYGLVITLFLVISMLITLIILINGLIRKYKKCKV